MTSPAPLRLTGENLRDEATGGATRQLVRDVVDRLAARCAFVAVEEYPEDPENYSLKHPLGALLVNYAGSFGDVGRGRAAGGRGVDDDGDLAGVSYRRTASVDVNIVCRNLSRAPSDAPAANVCDLVDLVCEALVGWQPRAWDGFDLVNDTFLGRTNATFEHRTRFVTSRLVITPASRELELDEFALPDVPLVSIVLDPSAPGVDDSPFTITN